MLKLREAAASNSGTAVASSESHVIRDGGNGRHQWMLVDVGSNIIDTLRQLGASQYLVLLSRAIESARILWPPFYEK
jgi:ribosomal silencing factor RsfS